MLWLFSFIFNLSEFSFLEDICWLADFCNWDVAWPIPYFEDLSHLIFLISGPHVHIPNLSTEHLNLGFLSSCVNIHMIAPHVESIDPGYFSLF